MLNRMIDQIKLTVQTTMRLPFDIPPNLCILTFMKLFVVLSTLALPLFAHTGHPGPHGHGDLSHLLLGLVVALPFALTATLWALRRKQAAEKQTTSTPKDDSYGQN